MKSQKQELNETILICAALPYANDEMHLGHIFSTFLPADILCRLYKLLQKKVLFLSGSDVYGTPLLIKGITTNTSPHEVYIKYHTLNAQHLKKMLIDIDIFGTTYGENHVATVQNIYLQLIQNDRVFWKDDNNFFCQKENFFVPDRLSICSICQLEECNHDIKTQRLCYFCHNEVQNVPCLTLVLKLDTNKSIQSFEKMRKNITTNSIGSNLLYNPQIESEKVISRNITWGVKIPDHDIGVFYVWFDALIGYDSISQGLWNKVDKRILFMGKDNIYFHIHMLPNIYDMTTIPTAILSGQFLCLENEKFSKSSHKGIFINDIDDQNVEYIRFYLAYIQNMYNDSNFDWKQFKSVTNNILINKIYNSLFRVISLIQQQEANVNIVEDMPENIHSALIKYQNSIENAYLGEAARTLETLSDEFNAWIQQNQLWKYLQSNIQKACWYASAICIMLYLIMPVHMLSMTQFFFNMNKPNNSLVDLVNTLNRKLNFHTLTINKLNRLAED